MKATLSVRCAARLIGVSDNLAYREISETEALLGVPVLRVQSKILIPTEPLRRKLGLERDEMSDAVDHLVRGDS